MIRHTIWEDLLEANERFVDRRFLVPYGMPGVQPEGQELKEEEYDIHMFVEAGYWWVRTAIGSR